MRVLNQPQTLPIEPGSSRTGRWLRDRRTKIALWIAIVEGVLAAVLHDITRWTVIAIAIPLIAVYAIWGRGSRSDTLLDHAHARCDRSSDRHRVLFRGSPVDLRPPGA